MIKIVVTGLNLSRNIPKFCVTLKSIKNVAYSGFTMKSIKKYTSDQRGKSSWKNFGKIPVKNSGNLFFQPVHVTGIKKNFRF
jgi:hypothetical protein